MARADLILNLVRAGKEGDRDLFSETVESLIAEERSKQHHIFAKRLSETLADNQRDNQTSSRADRLQLNSQKGLHEVTPERTINELILPSSVVEACSELVEEHNRRDILRSHNLEPRHRILLAGPPGNGKTSLAEGVAEALMAPLFVVQYEHVIGSYLGETSSRLSKIFDFVRQRSCVLFFDEFDTVAKERGDENDAGEIKRVVSSLLLQIDKLPSHVVVVVASNHPELLDRAVWRRFQMRLRLPRPGKEEVSEWLADFEEKHEISLAQKYNAIADTLENSSFAEVEQFGLDVLRRYVLSLPEANVNQIVNSRLKQWKERFQKAPSE